MKLRELRQRSAGEGTVWPPRWVGPSGPGQVPEDGALEGLERLGNRLLLQINIHGQRRTASLQWDPPPHVGEIETVMLGSMGATIRDLGDRELSTRGR